MTPPSLPAGCRAVREQLPAFSAGEISGAPAARLERHLADCSDCRSESRAYADAFEALRASAAAQRPVDLWPAVAASLGVSAPSPAPRSGSWWEDLAGLFTAPRLAWASGLVAAGIAIGVVAGFLLWRGPAGRPATPVVVAGATAPGTSASPVWASAHPSAGNPLPPADGRPTRSPAMAPADGFSPNSVQVNATVPAPAPR